jgi:NADPH-dependent 2,4-dienoyl-CoA reductase/sulfur reductase-like enzyme
MRYLIIGAGLAGAAAAAAIRDRDRDGSVIVLGAEQHAPYDRPPLTKKLWTGAKTVAQIQLHERGWYDSNGISLILGCPAASLDLSAKTVTDAQGRSIRYDRLLLAPGGTPRRLAIPGGDRPDICYFRTVDDYLRLRSEAESGRSALIIGGGFIACELAASLAINKIAVTMLFPGPYPCRRLFPAGPGNYLRRLYERHGVRLLADDAPVSVSRSGPHLTVHTRAGHEVKADIIAAGVGILPNVDLARQAGLAVEDGITVDERLRASRPDVYAAGDAAAYPSAVLGRRLRFEHWDNAQSQGAHAGWNMSGGRETYLHLPYFFSDMFDFGYEAVGEIDSALETFCDWREEYRSGVIYYLKDSRVRGVMAINLWDRMEAARALIRAGKALKPESLRGLILEQPTRA